MSSNKDSKKSEELKNIYQEFSSKIDKIQKEYRKKLEEKLIEKKREDIENK
jgi:hypothetical protein